MSAYGDVDGYDVDSWWDEADPEDDRTHDPDDSNCMCLRCELRRERMYGEG